MPTRLALLKLLAFKPAVQVSFLLFFCKHAILLALDYRLFCFVVVVAVFFWLMYRKRVIGHKGQTKCKSPFSF